ncbi:MAG: hypothetical protein JWM34_4123 [Ilumatobacteraceae bacterium]|nr:hypothetical protein [Ilumatobacteraceae bacterium]
MSDPPIDEPMTPLGADAGATMGHEADVASRVLRWLDPLPDPDGETIGDG